MEAGLTKKPMSESEIRRLPVLTLAYVGDSVFDLYVRTLAAAVEHKNAKDAHRFTVRFVCAAAQAAGIDMLLEKELLTEEECDIYRRGRNAKPHSTPKNAKLSDYHKATGFETLLGYLYLTGQQERVDEICRLACDRV